MNLPYFDPDMVGYNSARQTLYHALSVGGELTQRVVGGKFIAAGDDHDEAALIVTNTDATIPRGNHNRLGGFIAFCRSPAKIRRTGLYGFLL